MFKVQFHGLAPWYCPASHNVIQTDWAGRPMVFADKCHPAYDHLNAKEIMGHCNGTQVGDPRKGGTGMYEPAVLQDPPLRVIIGSDASKVVVRSGSRL